MLDSPDDYPGLVTFVTGPGKHCGKTTFMVRALELARRGLATRGETSGRAVGPAVLTVGYDGEARDWLSGARKPSIPVRPGDVFVTAERFLRSGGTCPEILDVVPGTTALGRLCIARATRDGTVALVGPEGNAAVAWTLDRLTEPCTGGGPTAGAILVDGAINRVTQAASWPGARMVYVMRVDRAGFERSVDLALRMGLLASLPVYTEPDSPGDRATAGTATGAAAGDKGATTGDRAEIEINAGDRPLSIDGVLTAETAARLPPRAAVIVVDDMTKVFLDWRELRAFIGARRLLVRRSIEFAGIVASCRGVSDAEFLSRLDGAPGLDGRVACNPYEAAA